MPSGQICSTASLDGNCETQIFSVSYRIPTFIPVMQVPGEQHVLMQGTLHASVLHTRSRLVCRPNAWRTSQQSPQHSVVALALENSEHRRNMSFPPTKARYSATLDFW